MIEVRLPWPSKKTGLSPNARLNAGPKARAVKAAREMAWGLALEARAHLHPWPEHGPIFVHLSFVPHRGSAPDIDNAIASMKAFLDGIADAMKVNDRRFKLSYDMLPGKQEPYVIAEIRA